MDGKEWPRVPVTSWRLVRMLWAEVEREVDQSRWEVVSAGSQSWHQKHRVPDLLVTWRKPIPSLEMKRWFPGMAPRGGLLEAGWGLPPPLPHHLSRSQWILWFVF